MPALLLTCKWISGLCILEWNRSWFDAGLSMAIYLRCKFNLPKKISWEKRYRWVEKILSIESEQCLVYDDTIFLHLIFSPIFKATNYPLEWIPFPAKSFFWPRPAITLSINSGVLIFNTATAIQLATQPGSRWGVSVTMYSWPDNLYHRFCVSQAVWWEKIAAVINKGSWAS